MTSWEWREELHERHRKEKLETYLFAMKEDLSEWLVGLMNISVTAETFMSVLDNGIHLCKLANMIQRAAERYLKNNPEENQKLPTFVATYKERGASYGSFVSRDNVANFIRWCRELGIQDVIMFESEDLVLHRYQKPVILTLLDVARRAAKFDVEPPDLVKMEEEIDEEIAMEQQEQQQQQQQQALSLSSSSHVQQESYQDDTQPVILKPKRTNVKRKSGEKAKNFIPKNLDTLVKETVEQCTCEDNPFPMEKIADGKYKCGENRVLIFVRVMRNHVMVRVGGGWDTLENYIHKHDPCRAGGRSSGGTGRHRQRCHTPNHQTAHDHDANLHSASNTSVASSDSSSSSSSLTRLSPVSSQNKNISDLTSDTDTKLKSMVCVFGVSSQHKSLTDLTAVGQKGQENGHNHTPTKRRPTTALVGKPLSHSALRAKLQEADLTFARSKTSDAILSRTRRRTRDTDSPNSIVKRRGNGSLSREASSDNLRAGRAKTTGMRRKSVDERRRKSPEVRRRSAVSPAPARRRLDMENETSVQKRSALRKDLNDNNLTFTRSFSADTIRGRRTGRTIASSPTTDAVVRQLQSSSRIPVPITTYGKPRGLKRTSMEDQGPRGTPNGVKTNTSSPNGGHLNNRCGYCGGECCTCDEGFIDGEISRSSPRPRTLFANGERQREFEENALSSRTNHTSPSSKIYNGNYNNTNSKATSVAMTSQEHQLNGNMDPDTYRNDNADISWKDIKAGSKNSNTDQGSSLEWKEVMTDILKFEENRISDKNL